MNAIYIIELVAIIGVALSTLIFNIIKTKKERQAPASK
jgi:hypothetical protein